MPARKRARVCVSEEFAWKRGASGRLERARCIDLPALCLELIFSFIDQRADAISAAATCRAWHQASIAAPVWSKVDISRPDAMSPSFNSRTVHPEQRHPPALESAFISFLMPRAHLVKWLRIARETPVVNLAGLPREGFADSERVCGLVAFCTNLEHLALLDRDTIQSAVKPLLPHKILATALALCPRLTSLDLPVEVLLGIDRRNLSAVETLSVSLSSCVKLTIRFEMWLSELPSLKTLTIQRRSGAFPLLVRSTSLRSFTWASMTALTGFSCPNLTEFHAEEYRASRVMKTMLSWCLPSQLMPAYANMNWTQLEATGGRFHLVA